MKVATGTSILRGIAIGRLKLHRKEAVETSRTSSLAPEEEYARFQAAQKAAQEQLGQLYEKALDEVGEDNAAIFEIHQMMLEDEDYVDAVKGILDSQGATAEYAVTATGENFAAAFAAMEDPYMQARSADVKDISRRVVNILTGTGAGAVQGDEPAILMADDLTPSETVQMDKSKLLGFITRGGSANSHTAILARTMGIPALVGVDFDESWDGQLAILDGCNHCVYVDPAPELLTAMEAKRRADLEQEALLQGLKKKPNVTLDGTEIQVYANIGGVGQTAAADEAGAEGVGLLRTEFLFMGRTSLPTEEEQYEAYASVSRAMGDRPAVVRTLDIGGDKALPYLGQEKEENPYLGRRGIRYCLARPEVFRTQLRALLRAGAERGNIRLMLPMVTGVQELRAARTMLEQEKQALSARGVAFDGAISLGVMIETPAAAVIADLLAKEADFFSIGTNDLVQYILAADRGNADIAELYAPCHPAVLRSIRDVIAAGRAADVPVCMCGEAAADPCLIPLWMAFGLDSFSAGPSALPEVRRTVSRWTEEEALCTAKEALACPDADAVRALLAARRR